jgi:preprotein translocase subunit SecG
MYWTNALIVILLVVYVIVCLLMCLVVMMQRSKQEGLGAAFGGGFTDAVWGAQTSQVLVKATIWFAALFFILSIALARLYSHRASLQEAGSPVHQQLLESVAPAKSATTTPTAVPNGSTNAVPLSAAVVPTATPMKPDTNIVAPTNAAPVPAK